MEREQAIDLAYKSAPYLIGVVGLALLNTFSFSWDMREFIRQRDGYKSVLSGNSEDLVCSHINHYHQEGKQEHPMYNDPNNGRLLTKAEELQYHMAHRGREYEIGMTKDANEQTIRGWEKYLKNKQRQQQYQLQYSGD